MVDGEQVYGDEVNVDGAKTPLPFFQYTAIQKWLPAKHQAWETVCAMSTQEAIPLKSRSTLPP